MRISRDWATPLTMGAFGLLAVTGVLMFFHADTPLNKAAHEWLSWGLLAAVAAHVVVNLPSLKRHLASRRTQAVLAACALVLGLSFLPLGGSSGGEPPFAGVVHAAAKAPLPLLAQLAGTDEATVRRRLADAGVAGADRAASVEAAVGSGLRAQMGALNAALGATPARD